MVWKPYAAAGGKVFVLLWSEVNEKHETSGCYVNLELRY